MNFRAPYALLQTATDAAEMRDRLEKALRSNGLLSGPIDRLVIPRVIPRGSGEVLVQYRISAPGLVWTDSGELTIYGEFFPDHVVPPDANRLESGSVNEFSDLKLRVWLFPHDPSLRHLRSVLVGEEFSRIHADILATSATGAIPSSEEHRVDILGYRLGRRLVARLSWEDDHNGIGHPDKHIVVKMCRPRQALDLWTRHRQMEHESLDWCGKGSTFLPSQYSIHEHTGSVFQEWRAGANLHDLMGQPSFVDGCRAAMEILDTMQQFHVTGLPVYRVEDELRHLDWLAGQTGTAFPGVARDLAVVLGALRRRAPEDVPDRVVCHRDYYDKQILYEAGQSTLIDFDTLAESDPALDFGNFLAHLQWRAHQSPESAQFLRHGEKIVWESVGQNGCIIDSHTEWWRAAAAFRIACIYLWRPRWQTEALAFLGQQVDTHSKLVPSTPAN